MPVCLITIGHDNESLVEFSSHARSGGKRVFETSAHVLPPSARDLYYIDIMLSHD